MKAMDQKVYAVFEIPTREGELFAGKKPSRVSQLMTNQVAHEICENFNMAGRVDELVSHYAVRRVQVQEASLQITRGQVKEIAKIVSNLFEIKSKDAETYNIIEVKTRECSFEDGSVSHRFADLIRSLVLKYADKTDDVLDWDIVGTSQADLNRGYLLRVKDAIVNLIKDR